MAKLMYYKLGMVNSKSFVSKDFLRNKWKYKLAMHFKHGMIGKHFTETSNKVEHFTETSNKVVLRINCVPDMCQILGNALVLMLK